MLKQANYPSTMGYLDHYKEEKEKRYGQLEEKYVKVREGERSKPIPNFQAIHYKQIQEMETAKVQKRTLTKPQPFNLSQNRSIKQPIYQL